MIDNLIIAIIGLGLISLISFVVAFKNTKWVLVFFVPLIVTFIGLGILSYDDLMGRPINTTWEKLPDKITVIFFIIENEDFLVLWLHQEGGTKLMRLPLDENAIEALEEQRSTMGEGKPVTFGISGKNDKTKGLSEEGGEISEPGKNGWRYKFESEGIPIFGSMPPK